MSVIRFFKIAIVGVASVFVTVSVTNKVFNVVWRLGTKLFKI